MWISGSSVTLKVSDGRKSLAVENLKVQQYPGLPNGPEVNDELVDPNSTLRREVEKVWNNGGGVKIGRMRVLNGGGAYTLPANMLDLTSADGTHDAIWGKLCQKFGEPETATPVVFRDWGAPGTYGVFDGGGAGRGESIPDTAKGFLTKMCLGEPFGEIGMLGHLPDGSEGRIAYSLTSGGRDIYSHWLNRHVTEEWQKAHGSVPLVLATASVEFMPLPDEMTFDGELVTDVKLAIEWHSASIECLAMSKPTFKNIPAGTRLRFIDLESRGGKGLNRPIGIVLKRGDEFAIVQYRNGLFDHNSPMIPICEQTLAMCANEKFQAVVEMIRGQ